MTDAQKIELMEVALKRIASGEDCALALAALKAIAAETGGNGPPPPP